mgnify:CR=1 FL=1
MLSVVHFSLMPIAIPETPPCVMCLSAGEALPADVGKRWEEKAGCEFASQKLSLAITPYFFNLIDRNDPDCPIRKQVIPRAGLPGDPGRGRPAPAGKKTRHIGQWQRGRAGTGGHRRAR